MIKASKEQNRLEIRQVVMALERFEGNSANSAATLYSVYSTMSYKLVHHLQESKAKEKVRPDTINSTAVN